MALTPQEKANITTQLRSLEAENKLKVEYFKDAADLHDTGYQSDVAMIEQENERYRQTKIAEIASLNEQVTTLTSEKVVLTEDVAKKAQRVRTLEDELTKNNIPVPVEEIVVK